MKTIWKYVLQEQDVNVLGMPEGAQVLDVQVQSNAVMLWALVDPSAVNESRRFRLFGTGHPIEDPGPGIYVGTYQIRGGSLVFHVFEQPL